MEKTFLNTRELAEYLDINEKKIYALIVQKKLPATKITGKWLFPKTLVDNWLVQNLQDLPYIKKKMQQVLLITGSDDPLFHSLLNDLRLNNTSMIPFFSTTGSLTGLKILDLHKAHIACCHLLDKQQGDYNIPFIHEYLPHMKVVIINFALREQGFIVHKQNPFDIASVKDLIKKDLRFLNRQPGSGTRLLLDNLLMEYNIPTHKINGYENQVNTHWEIGLNILAGHADCGIGIKGVARQLGLGFIPITKERFDVIINKAYFFNQEVQSMIDIMKTSGFKKRAVNFGGYDVTNTGSILYVS